MRVGWLGLGKVGSCCSLVLADAGHTVTGYDPVAKGPVKIPAGEQVPPGFPASPGVTLAGSPHDVVAASDIVFVCVQTPHEPGYGGDSPAPEQRRDFEYAYLVQACRDVCASAARLDKYISLVVVSTVLPGTMDRLIRPLAGYHVTLVYSPVLISLGTTIRDFTSPPVVIAGADRETHLEPLRRTYGAVHGARFAFSGFATAELAKVAWNACLSMRITFANMLAEIAHATGGDVDEVTGLLEDAYSRSVRAGMGDGGPCRPRDLIALSWLSERLGLSFDLPGMLVKAREAQSQGLAELAMRYFRLTGLPLMILGTSYKPGTKLEDGSPALLLAEQLGLRRYPYQRDDGSVTDADPALPAHEPRVFVIAVPELRFADFTYPAGSVVIDPWGIAPDRPGTTVVRIGRQ